MLSPRSSLHRRVRVLIAALAGIAAVVAGIVVTPVSTSPATAADLSKFDAGNIISDAVFFNANAMSQAQIQTFLQGKEANCSSSATCVKDYSTTTKSIAADPMCKAYAGGGSERASAIIYKVAQACGINPQVLLVMMQKEQGLVTSVAPSAYAYNYAMGANCPDTTGCNGNSSGFFVQVYSSAWQLKRYANPPGTSNYFTWYAPGHTWNILYSPTTACGTKAVYVQNQATADLYYYTPYTPNAAALNAGYGTGDSCSAYGNRNFYNYFTDWFGSTQTGSAPPAPTLSSLDRGGYVLSLDAGGTLWGYPISTTTATWGARVTTATGASGLKWMLSVGDLDGDGHNDVLGVTPAGEVSLYRGTGGTSYLAPHALGVSFAGARLVAAAGDATGDGIPDVYTIGTDNRLLLWRGNGSGGFAKPLTIPGDWSGVDMISGGLDLSGDLLPDLVARTTGGALMLYLGNGKGGFSGSKQIGVGWSAMTSIFSPGDVTGDGKADILARDAAGNLRLYTNAGGGALAGGSVIGTGWQTMTALSGPAPAAVRARVAAAGVGDLNGDLAPDVLAAASSGALYLYPGNGRGGWGTASVVFSAWDASSIIPLGDFSGDGYRDVGGIAHDGSFMLYSGNAAGGLQAGTPIGSGWGALTALVGGIDFDGDGNSDVLARNAAGQLLLYRGNGAGGWMSGSGTVVGSGWNAMTRIFAVGDFDGGHHSQLLAVRTDGTLWLYTLTGTGGWLSSRQVGQGWTGMTSVFSPGDFDGDGAPDVLARNAAGQLLLYRGNGKGGWAGASVIGAGWNGMRQID